MIVTVTVHNESGTRSYTGHVVYRGPVTMEMLLTDPFPLAGRCVQFPLSQVVSETTTPGGRPLEPTSASA
jgi:hypothetical protein